MEAAHEYGIQLIQGTSVNYVNIENTLFGNAMD